MEELPNFNSKTGISKEYVKAFGRLNMYFRSIYGKTTTPRIKKFAYDNIIRFPYRVKIYTEWFKPEDFGNVVNEQNKEAVQKLEKIAQELNMLLEKEKILEGSEKTESYRPLILFNQAMETILGVSNFDFKQICELGDSEINKYFW